MTDLEIETYSQTETSISFTDMKTDTSTVLELIYSDKSDNELVTNSPVSPTSSIDISSIDIISRDPKSLSEEPIYNFTTTQFVRTDSDASTLSFSSDDHSKHDTYTTDVFNLTSLTSDETTSDRSDNDYMDFSTSNFQTDSYKTFYTIESETTGSSTDTTEKIYSECPDCDNCNIPDVSDCTKYFICQNGSKVSRQCQLSYLFSNVSKECEAFDKVSCNSNSSQCIDNEGFYPDPDNCSSFLFCYHGVAYNRACPKGLFYNPTKRTCDLKSECGMQPILPSSRNYEVECECENCALPDSDDCSKYYLCLDSLAYELKCEDGLLFNPETSNCDYPGKFSCAKYSPECLEKNGFFPVTGNCSKYYHCVGGVAYQTSCDANQHFSISTESCEDPCDAECDVSLDCITSTTRPASVCKEPNGFYPHPTDCNKFYKCVDYLPILSECIGDDHFSPINNICQDPCDALCDVNLDCVAASIAATLTNANILSTSPNTEGITAGDSTPNSEIPDGTTHSLQTATEESRSNFSILPLIFETAAVTDEDSSVTLEDSSVTLEDSSVTLEDTSDKARSKETSVSTSETENELITIEFKTQNPDQYTNSMQPETLSTVNPLICEQGDGVYPKHGDCDSFIACLLGKPREMKCPEGLHFSPTTKHCEYPCVAKCDKNFDCFTPEEATTSAPLPLTICPVKDFLPVPGYCAYYYNCTDGIRKKMKCPPRLHFNPTSRVCDFPSRANCGQPRNPLYRPDRQTQCPCETCFIPSTESCNDYYLCLNKTAYHMTCSNGLLFDASKNTCNFADAATCEITVTTPSTVSPTTFVATTTTMKTTTAKEFKCPERNGMFRNPSNCGSFIHCSNWWPYVKACPGKLHFSTRTERCEYPCFAQCDSSLSCVDTEQPEETTNVPGITPDPLCLCINCRHPSEESCTKYIECKKGRPTIKTCPRGQTFDSKRQECDWAHRVDCKHSDICFRRNGLFPYKGDCHKFVHCSNGIPYIKTCPAGLEFDAQTLRCEWSTGKCADDVKSNFMKGVNLVPEPFVQQEWSCPSSYGYFGHHRDCKYYYVCIDGMKHEHSCSQNLLFNPSHNTCDWPKHVKCHDTHKHSQRRCRVFDRHVECLENRTNLANPHCDMFYDCSTGKPCSRRCPKGLYFNAVAGICDEPQNVRCTTSDGDSYSLKDFAKTCKHKRRGHIKDPANSSCYYRCDHDKVVRSCCSRSRVFDERRNRCVWQYKYY